MNSFALASIRIALFALALTGPMALLLASGEARAADAAPARAAGTNESDLPIRRIVLYRSGVGYFERQGTIEGDATATLRFKTQQVNDILKSMVLLDLDGGRVNAINYGSKEPLARRLESFGVDISAAPSIADLFRQLRGSRVSLTGPDGAVEGTILGVESRPIAPSTSAGAGQPVPPITDVFATIVTGSGIKAVRISEISSFRFLDETLNEELNKALAALAEQRAENTKSVDLSFSGEAGKPRRVVVAYTHEMPVWKTSYRLVLPDDEKGAKPDPARALSMTMQAWAIVENTTDHDWKDVRLSLASGRPVSFTMDLYQPLFTTRPNIAVPVLTGIAPRVYESVANRQSFAVMGREASGLAAASVASKAQRDRADTLADAPHAEQRLNDLELEGDSFASYAAQAQASAGVAGETFMYTLDAPVTLERQRSAMLPILNAAIEGRRVSIYNAEAFPKHPMRGVKITNGEMHLMPGPIAVYDGAAYAGDSQIPHTSRGDDRILSYAVDLDVLGQTESAGTESIVKFKVVDGLLQFESRYRTSTTYTMTSNDTLKPRLILIEHSRLGGWDLIEPAKPSETTESLYRFELPLEPGKSTALKVVQEQTRTSGVALVDYDLPTLLTYAKQGKASQSVVDAVKKAAAIQSRVLDRERAVLEFEARMSEITSEQNRIRSNMQSVDRNSDLYRRYATKLNEQETELENLRTQRDEARKARNDAEAELREYLRDLDVE